MKNRFYRFVTLVLLMVGAFLTPQTSAQQQEKPNNQKSSASVNGSVRVRGKGQSGIEVRLMRLDPSTPRTELGANTGDDGAYRFSDVPPATYQVLLVSKDFYFTDARGPKTLVVGVGEHIKGLDFEMLPGAVVSGRVRDTEGRPLADRMVTLFVPKPPPAKEGTLMPTRGRAQTDSSGAYRIFGAPAGRYFIGVQEWLKNELTTSPSQCSETLYPGVTDPARAVVVELAEADHVENIDITVGGDSPCFSASGQIIDGESGVPLARATYGVAKVEGGRANYFNVGLAWADDNGEFKIGGLLPGRYEVVFRPNDTYKVYAEPVEFEVVNQNLSGLTVKTSAGAGVSGSIVVEGTTDKAVWAKLLELQLNAGIDTGQPGLGGGHFSTIAPDGTFHISGLPAGKLTIHLLSTTSIKRDFVLLRTELDGVVQPRNIPLKANEQITGLKVVVAYGTGIIRGAVKYENGTPWSSTERIALFRTDGPVEVMWSPVDVRGNFLLEGVPAGSYWLELSAFSPGLHTMVSVRKRLEVVDGAASNITMTLELGSNSPAKTGP
jgi:protocatechuate 3,4-dioxygenase beta subunit